mmetsp:Transcript_42527/g.117361  ORF Transcript_42527/g.117361 Transcript_42527/m.117361 type:complete len:360 (-) Transcript_42527:327-1406(-)
MCIFPALAQHRGDEPAARLEQVRGERLPIHVAEAQSEDVVHPLRECQEGRLAAGDGGRVLIIGSDILEREKLPPFKLAHAAPAEQVHQPCDGAAALRVFQRLVDLVELAEDLHLSEGELQITTGLLFLVQLELQLHPFFCKHSCFDDLHELFDGGRPHEFLGILAGTGFEGPARHVHEHLLVRGVPNVEMLARKVSDDVEYMRQRDASLRGGVSAESDFYSCHILRRPQELNVVLQDVQDRALDAVEKAQQGWHEEQFVLCTIGLPRRSEPSPQIQPAVQALNLHSEAARHHRPQVFQVGHPPAVVRGLFEAGVEVNQLVEDSEGELHPPHFPWRDGVDVVRPHRRRSRGARQRAARAR